MSNKHEQNTVDVKQKNVFQKPLTQHSHPSTSASNLPSNLTTGLCSSSSPIAANMTASFLDFSSKNGLDLRSSGVQEGSRYCIDTQTWKKAVDSGVDAPRVKLESTHEAALKSVDLETLKKWKAEQDNDSGTIWPRDKVSGATRQSGEIGGKQPKS